MAKRASNILSWNVEQAAYLLSSQENPQPADFFEQAANWFAWLENHKSFAFQGKNGRLSLQKETRPSSRQAYWYAYQRQGKQTVKQYLGGSDAVTVERLEVAARHLATRADSRVADLIAPQPEIDEINTLALLKPPEILALATTQAEAATLAGPNDLSMAPPEPVLEPKLRMPRLHSSLLPRRRLLDRLDEGLEHKLTLVSAPAGFGKTTLVRQWLADRFESYPPARRIVPKIAWVSLDAGDNDPVRFWRYLIMACHASGLSVDQTALEQLNTPAQPPYHPVSLQVVLITFLNELTQAGGPGPNILVLEDYHVLTSAQLHESLVFFVENLPTNLHLIIITRHDPPLPLARLRGQNELSELHAGDLRFSAEETWDFLQKNNAYDFSEETVRRLDRHLEGWGTGLRLLTLALQGLQGQSQIEKFLETFAGSHHSIQDYFVTEVLNVLPDSMQAFILQTSVLDRLTPELCAALTGESESESEKVLETLAKGNLFLEPLSGSGEWYRYHALFAESMQHELRRRYGGASLAELYSRASRWFEQNGLFPDAVETTLHANDFEEAARIIEKIIGEEHKLGMQFQEINEFYTFRRWLKEIPTAIIRRYPLLCVNYAQAIFFTFLVESSSITPAGMAQVIEALHWAEEGWKAENRPGKLAQVYTFRAMLSNMDGQIDEAVNWARQAMELLSEDEHLWRGMVLNVFGSYELYNGQIDRAKRFLNEVRYNSNALGNRNITRANMSLLAWAYWEQGELNQASEYFKLVLTEARDFNDQDDITHAQLGLAWLSFEWNDLAAAWQQTQEVIESNLKITDNENLTEANLIQIQILYAQGQFNQAHQRLAALLNQVQQPLSLIEYQQYRAVRLAQARFFLKDGNLAAFERWVNSLNPAEPTATGKALSVFHAQRIGETLLLARGMTSRGAWEEALLLLEPLLTEVQESGRFRYALKVRLNMALALVAGKNFSNARQLVQAVLSQAYIEGYMRLFLDEGEPMINLLRATSLPAASKALHEYRQKILQAFDLGGSIIQAKSAGEPLSPQERRVLALLVAGLSYPEIARELVVSVNTIKTQVKSIYQKLNVNNRMQAQAAARQLKSSS